MTWREWQPAAGWVLTGKRLKMIARQ